MPDAKTAEVLLNITAESAAAIRAEWEELFAQVPSAPPFLHPAWTEAWLRHHGSGTSPVHLALRDGEQLVAVAVLDMDATGARGLGDHNVTDYSGVLALPGYEARAADGVLEWLAEDLTSRLELWGIAADDPMRMAFAEAARGRGWTITEEDEAVCPRAALPGGWEEFVAGLNKHDRHEIRRKLRHLESHGSPRLESAAAPEDVATRMDRLFEFMRASNPGKDGFLTPAMEAFFRDIAARYAALGMLRLSTLFVDGQEAAMVLCFERSGTTYLYNSGYDPAFSHLAVGLLSKALALQDAIARGYHTFDFLRGDEDYKRHLGGVPQAVVTLKLVSRG